MADNYTEVTNTSWFSRLGNSFGGIGAGLVMIALATFLLYWNEGRAVRTGDAIAEAQMQTVALPGISTLDSSYDGKLVYATGRVVTEDTLTDSMFGITTKAIRLRRKVEYYDNVYCYNHTQYVYTPFASDVPAEYFVVDETGCLAIAPIVLDITDAMRELAVTKGMTACDFEGKRYDIGSKFGFLQANIDLGLKHPETADALRAYIKELAVNL